MAGYGDGSLENSVVVEEYLPCAAAHPHAVTAPPPSSPDLRSEEFH